jgi:hypothetical protein
VNSVADVGAMILGFWLAARLPVWVTVALIFWSRRTVDHPRRVGAERPDAALPTGLVATWQAGR